MSYRSRVSKRMGFGGLAALAAAAVVLGACGSASPASAPPQKAINTAFQSLGSRSGIDLHISLGVTGTELQQIAAEDGSSKLTPAVANDIAATSVVVDLNTGNGKPLNSKQLRTDRSEQLGLAVQVGASDPIELRYVDQTFYLRADVSTLLNDLGQNSSAASGFRSALQGANAYVPGLAALGQGSWVSVPESALQGLTQALPTGLPDSTGASNPAAAAQLWSQIEKAFTSNSTFVKAGTRGGRTHYTVALAVKPFVHDVEVSLPSSLASIPGASSFGTQFNRAVNKIPAKQKLVADVWVRGGKVQEIDVDLNQFMHKFGFAVPVRIVIGAGTPVLAPTSATPLNLSKVGGLLGGMLSQHSAS